MPMIVLGAAVAGAVGAASSVVGAFVTGAAITFASVGTAFAVGFAGSPVGRDGRVA